MAFRKPKQQPQFADLKGILAQTKDTENPLYQTVQVLIDRLTQFQGVTLEQIADINNSVNDINSIVNITADKTLTYLTTKNESLKLPNSSQLLAGSGITFDDSVKNQRTISSTGGSGSGYWTPLTDGNVDEADLIFANGEAIAVFISNASGVS